MSDPRQPFFIILSAISIENPNALGLTGHTQYALRDLMNTVGLTSDQMDSLFEYRTEYVASIR